MPLGRRCREPWWEKRLGPGFGHSASWGTVECRFSPSPPQKGWPCPSPAVWRQEQTAGLDPFKVELVRLVLGLGDLEGFFQPRWF